MGVNHHLQQRGLNSYKNFQSKLGGIAAVTVTARQPGSPAARAADHRKRLFWPLLAGRSKPLRIAAVVTPPPHRGPHRQNLVLEFRTGLARHQMQLQGDAVGQAERTVFASDQQGGGLPASASEQGHGWFHVKRAEKNNEAGRSCAALAKPVNVHAFLQAQAGAVQLDIEIGRRQGQLLTDFLRGKLQPLAHQKEPAQRWR